MSPSYRHLLGIVTLAMLGVTPEEDRIRIEPPPRPGPPEPIDLEPRRVLVVGEPAPALRPPSVREAREIITVERPLRELSRAERRAKEKRARRAAKRKPTP